jgi:hypothetical protein
MKRYSVLSALWLVACGAGAGPGDDDNSTLSAPLATDDEQAAEPSQLASADEAEEPESDPDSWIPAGDDAEPGSAGSAAPTSAPAELVIGGGGQAWSPPTSGAVVWCHADVPIGCPVIEPTPDGGRLVVVQGPMGGVAVDAEGTQVGGSAAPHGEVIMGEASGSSAGPAGEIIFVDAVPMPGAPPSPAVPVVIGGSLPPFPGTCVAVTFGPAGEGTVIGGGGAGVPGQPPRAGTSAGGSGGSPSADVDSAADPVEPPSAGSANTDVAGEQQPTSGGASLPAPPHGAVVPDAPLPALPPPGFCLGVSWPAPPPNAPSSGTSGTATGPAHPPTPPTAGACVSVAFAAPADPSAPVPAPAPPVMCAAPHAPAYPVGSAGTEPPVAAVEPVRADEVR